MTVKTSEIFDTLLANLKVGDTATSIASRRDEIAKALNKGFRETESCTAYKLMVGSFGRHRGSYDLEQSEIDKVYYALQWVTDCMK